MEAFNLSSNSTSIQTESHKYGYAGYEVFFMVIITGFTNLTIAPTLVIFYKQKMMFQFFISIFTVLSSFMYHVLDSLSAQSFFLDIGEWHRLDNVGSIVGFMMLFGYISDIQDLALETNLNYIGLFVTIISQEADPWNLYFTIVPIITWGLIYLACKVHQRQVPDLNPVKVKTGLLFLFLAMYCFYYGLDEYKDYLRFYHGLWHLFVSAFCFQFYQSKLKGQDNYTLRDIWTKPRIKYNYYWPFDKELTK